MSPPTSTSPRLRAGFHHWSFRDGDRRILFVGKGPHGHRIRAFQELTDPPRPELAWPRQIHSDRVLEPAGAGVCGEADALMTRRRGLAVSVATADCVPIIVAAAGAMAAIHAGWRGLAQNIIDRALEELDADSSTARAWIGPAIGPCCYEVDLDVAKRVVAAADDSVLVDQQPRPHLDLVGTSRIQLQRHGVQVEYASRCCTRCSPDQLWSYRRDGAAAGRNWVFAWQTQA